MLRIRLCDGDRGDRRFPVRARPAEQPLRDRQVRCGPAAVAVGEVRLRSRDLLADRAHGARNAVEVRAARRAPEGRASAGPGGAVPEAGVGDQAGDRDRDRDGDRRRAPPARHQPQGEHRQGGEQHRDREAEADAAVARGGERRVSRPDDDRDRDHVARRQPPEGRPRVGGAADPPRRDDGDRHEPRGQQYRQRQEQVVADRAFEAGPGNDPTRRARGAARSYRSGCRSRSRSGIRRPTRCCARTRWRPLRRRRRAAARGSRGAGRDPPRLRSTRVRIGRREDSRDEGDGHRPGQQHQAQGRAAGEGPAPPPQAVAAQQRVDGAGEQRRRRQCVDVFAREVECPGRGGDEKRGEGGEARPRRAAPRLRRRRRSAEAGSRSG